MKRNRPQDDSDSEQEEAEMDVDDEEKAEPEIEEDSDVDDEDVKPAADGEEVTFLDTFYGISSQDAQERAQAAQAMLHYCLTGPDANTKDAAYALRRLLNGLCSGRAAARQGNASALATFLKIAATEQKLKDIQEESRKEGEDEVSDLMFVRRRLLLATDPKQTPGRRKGSEERDYQFGRLFGILSVVRSGILAPDDKQDTKLEDIIENSSEFVKALAELYRYKKWMREPAAHAIGTLLTSLYDLCMESTDAVKIVEHLVEHHIVPELLLTGDSALDDDDVPLFQSYSAEQVAIAVNIQSNVHFHKTSLPSPLDRSILTKETIPLIASALSETSVVTQPRTHLVWDTIWLFISESDESKSEKNVDTRKARKLCPVGDDSVDDIVDGLMKHVVIGRLLGMEQSESSGKGQIKATHERRALALCIVRNLAGVEFVSSVAGRTKLQFEPQVIENLVLSPIIVRRLFLDVICAGTGGKKKQAEHMLKPLALQVLDSMTLVLGGDTTSFGDETAATRLAVVRALLRGDPRFDARTKTSTVRDLLCLTMDSGPKECHMKMWMEFISFVEKQVAIAEPPSDQMESKGVLPYEAVGYTDLLFQMGKRLMRTDTANDSRLFEYKSRAVRRILSFLMVTAFFDCEAISNQEALKKPSKKKKKSKASETKRHPAVDSALAIKAARSSKTSTPPYEVRTVLSARFFSLLAESVNAITHSSGSDRDSRMLDLLLDISRGWKELENAGAKTIATSEDTEDVDESEDPEAIVAKLQKTAHAMEESKDKIALARKRLALACAVLASSLRLHQLSCGVPEDAMDEDDPDADDECDAQDIRCFISDIEHVFEAYTKENSGEDNPLLSLAELCAQILSSPLCVGNQSRGASPKLLREVVRHTWVSGLNLSAASPDTSSVDVDVIAVLLGSIGAMSGEEVVDDEMDLEEGSGESDDEGDDSDGPGDDAVFAKAAQTPDILEDEEIEEQGDSGSDVEDDADVELEPSRLQTMLEEDGDEDVDEGELEHHAGADKALARLIQLKQEARKAGKLARERLEIARQLRCTVLLETLVIGKPDTWGSLLRTDIVLQTILPILTYRKELEKSLAKVLEKGAGAGTSEKRDLLERLTALLKTKIFKVKVSSLTWSQSVSANDLCVELASELIDQARDRVSKDHQLLCSNGLLMIIRAIPDPNEKLQLASSVYDKAISEWSTKKTTRLESGLFDELIHHSPVVAQATLVAPLSVAASTARSAFLKTESLRLLTLLYNTKLNTGVSDLEKNAMKRVVGEADSVAQCIIVAFKDPEMKKAKRAREVLKALERVIAFVATVPERSTITLERLDEVKLVLTQLKIESESQGVTSTCDKLLKDVESFAETLLSTRDADSAIDEDEGAENAEHREASTSGKSKKKKKKKKGKKK